MNDRKTQLGRSARLDEVLRRDGNRCLWCDREFSALVPPTTDHLIPRIKGGPSWLENEVAACRRCNSDRGHRSPAAWLQECEQRGWRPHVTAVVDRLAALAGAIAVRGGQRRARSYLDGQLRRLS